MLPNKKRQAELNAAHASELFPIPSPNNGQFGAITCTCARHRLLQRSFDEVAYAFVACGELELGQSSTFLGFGTLLQAVHVQTQSTAKPRTKHTFSMYLTLFGSLLCLTHFDRPVAHDSMPEHWFVRRAL